MIALWLTPTAAHSTPNVAQVVAVCVYTAAPLRCGLGCCSRTVVVYKPSANTRLFQCAYRTLLKGVPSRRDAFQATATSRGGHGPAGRVGLAARC